MPTLMTERRWKEEKAVEEKEAEVKKKKEEEKTMKRRETRMATVIAAESAENVEVDTSPDANADAQGFEKENSKDISVEETNITNS